MEPNKQIDYGTLEWFDCKNNFPPMSIDLYVDSEHGYGIGRLGRREKDKSIIWTVHLDSGEVYMVYAFYKVKRWAYMPKDEKTNTKLKHELMLNKERIWVPCYLKSEADKFIADLEESHKMEVEQLLIEIAELKEKLNNSRNARKYWRKEYLIEYKECSYHKYKRCLAMADKCAEAYNRECGLNPEEMTDKEFYKQQIEFWPRWNSKWLKIAEKFKEAK